VQWQVDFVCCNPPFYKSREAFLAENLRKQMGLEKNKAKRRGSTGSSAAAAPPPAEGKLPLLRLKNQATAATAAGSDNFGGGASELWCPGGEVRRKCAHASPIICFLQTKKSHGVCVCLCVCVCVFFFNFVFLKQWRHFQGGLRGAHGS
jgi:hypothetical protein